MIIILVRMITMILTVKPEHLGAPTCLVVMLIVVVVVVVVIIIRKTY